MPNNDLGTAHGRIRIDFDDRGTAAALVAIQKMQQQMLALNTRVVEMEKTFSKSDVSISKTASSIKKAEKESKSWITTLFGAQRVTRLLDKDILDLAQDVNELNKKFQQFRQNNKPLETAYKVLDRYQRLKPQTPVNALNKALSELGKNTGVPKLESSFASLGKTIDAVQNKLKISKITGNLNALNKALDSVGIGFGSAMKSLGGFVIGQKDAMNALPEWTRYVYAFSLSLGKLGAAGLLAGKALNAGFITKFLDTNAFRTLAMKLVGMGAMLKGLGFGGSKLANMLLGSESSISNRIKKLSHDLSGASRVFNKWFKPVEQGAKAMQNFVFGVGLMGSGVANIISKFMWIAKIPKPILMGLGVIVSTVLPAAFQILSKSLVGTSNLLVGLLSGVKQLSGGFLALPGAIASIGAAAATFKTIFGGGVTDLFKALVSPDAKKAMNALAEMPAHLRPISQAILDANTKFREMQTEIQKIAFKGVEDQIKSLAEKYIPLLQNGMSNVTLAIRGSKDELVKFLEQSQTQKDVNTIFSNTAEIIGNIKQAIRPAADGLRDIATVGSGFITEMSSGVGDLAQKFAAWAKANRESGQMLEWMRDAKEGVIDLVKGTKDLAQGLWNIVTVFKNNNGAGFLDSFANAMHRFNRAIQGSAKGGALFDLSGMVKNFASGSDKIELFKQVFQSFMKMMSGLAPAITNVSNAFSSIFVPQIQNAMESLGHMMEFASAFHLDSIVGTILGLIAVIKLIPTFLGPAWNALRIFGGGFMVLTNSKAVLKALESGILAVAGNLEKMTWLGKKMSVSLVNMAASANGFLAVMSRLALPVAIVTAAIAGFVAVTYGGKKQLEEFDEQLTQNATSLKVFGSSLREAFLKDNGLIGSTVMDSLSSGVDEMIRNLEDTAEKAPGLLAEIRDYITNSGQNTDQILKLGDQGKVAGLAAEKLKELRKQGIDLESILASSSYTFDAWVTSLSNSGEPGKAAADELKKARQEFELTYQSMKQLGTAGIQVANGIKKIAEAGGDAASKLDGLKQALQGLGFLKVDALQAAADYTTAISTMADDIRQAIETNGGVEQAFDKVNGTLNTSSKLGAALVPIFNRVSNAFLTTATHGGNVDETIARLNKELDAVAPQLNMTGQQLKDFFRNNLGAAPEPIKLLLQLEGKEEFVQKLGMFIAEISTTAETNVPVIINFKTPDEAKRFDDWIENIVQRDITDVNGVNVVLKTGIAPPSPEEWEKLRTSLQQLDINPGTLAGPGKMPTVPLPAAPVAPPGPANPAVLPPEIGAKPFPNPVLQPQPLQPPPPLPNFPAPLDTGGTGGLDAASSKVDEVGGKMDKLVSADRQLKLNTDKLDEASQKLEGIEKTFNEKKLKADVEVNGIEKLNDIPSKAQAITDKIKELFTTLKDQITKMVDEAATKVTSLSAGITNELNNLTASAKTAGSAFVDAFAEGMGSNPSAINAARTLAEKVIAQYHQSPPKEGPLAKHGDAAKYAGKQFVTSYADALRQYAPQAGSAAAAVAGFAAGGMGSKETGAPGAFMGQIIEMANFASSLVGVFSRISETVAGFAKFISDPLGKGTFFGGSLGFKKLSAAELKRRRDTEDQQSLRSMMDGSQRDDTRFKDKLKLITDAENAVVDQQGYKTKESVKTVGAMIKEAFPEIASIGGARADSKPFHRDGRALDIMIPDFNTKEGKALGDRINNWALANADKLGIDYTIWQDFYQPANGDKGNFMGNKDPNTGHFNHIHLNFAPGASIDMAGIEMTAAERDVQTKKSAQDAAKTALQALQEQYGPPALSASDATSLSQPQQLRLNPQTGQFEFFKPEGQKDLPNGYLNPETKKPWTKAEAEQYVRENPKVITLPDNMTMERFSQIMSDPAFVNTSQEETLNKIGDGNAQIAKALEIAKDPRSFDNQPTEVINALTAIDQEITRLNDSGTVGNQLVAQDLESVKSTIMDKGGYVQNENPIDQISGFISNAAGVASDVIGTFVTGVEAVGAADNIAKTLVRGMQGTEDVGRVVDNVQKFIELGGKIAGSVSSVAGLASSIVGAAGGADPSGGASGAAAALGAVSTIAGLVQAGYETANAVIDITQEAVKIFGGYAGNFLGYLVGGPNGPLAGNVKFLLDQKTNQLLSYTAENPMDKRTFGTSTTPDARQQLVGNINVYGGPGSDPRDLTRQMMFQINTAQYAGTLAQ